jgi:hypothetical protein
VKGREEEEGEGGRRRRRRRKRKRRRVPPASTASLARAPSLVASGGRERATGEREEGKEAGMRSRICCIYLFA